VRDTRISHFLRDYPSRGAWVGAAIAATLVLLSTTLLAPNATTASAAGPCAVGSNPIVCENSKPGTDPSVWDINGAGDPSIQGFSSDISVNVGSSIDFKINTNAKAYSIRIFRSGYYQGLGARQIATVTPSATLPQSQPQCISDATTGLYDCGNWAVSASWSVPSTAASGVYFALLHRNDTGGESHITFVVRDDSSHSAVLFQTSDPTWQAYNTYGGSDFYQGGAVGRAYKISYNRPVMTRGDNSGRDFYFSNEYPLVRFLEKNGYDVSYFSGVDSDRFGTELTNHRVFLSVGHNEYWSTGQRANIVAARDAGVNMQFLSGNEGYWHTRYEPSVAGTSTPYRTLVSYKETWSNAKIDPSPTWTGTWRDPRFASQANGAGLPENGVTGTEYMSNFTDLPVTVTAAEGKLRLWRNTSLSSLAPGTSQALAAHTIGYESDEDVDNPFRQSGLIRLSTTTGPTPQYLQDFGNTVLAGTTTHHLTVYRASGGALVFSAGSIQWTWGLDQTHDGNGAAADPRIQQAQVNLLADMGALPLTLDPSLVAAAASTDTTPPTVSVTSPTNGATIANGANVTVTGTAADVGGVVAGIEISTDGSSWHMATGTTSWSYTYVQHGAGTQAVRIRAVDDSANYAATPATVSYNVTAPYSILGAEVPKMVDSGDASSVELGLKFSPSADGFITGVRFYKSTANTGIHTGSLWNASGVRMATVTFSSETASGWQTASFSSPSAVSVGQTYTISYSAPNGHYSAANNYWAYVGLATGPMNVTGGFGASGSGVYGNPGTFPTSTFAATNYYVDAVYSTTDTSPLVASSQWPLAGSSSVPVNTTVSATFSKAVNATTIAFTVVDQNGSAATGGVGYDSTSRTATFTPSSALNNSVKYTVTLTANDTNGVALSSGGTWTFTTVSPPAVIGQCPCTLYDDSAVPGILQAADTNAVTLGLRFSTLQTGLISAVKFYKGAGNIGSHVGTLWSTAGTKLATGTFTNESTSGWQTLAFATPVAVTSGTTYVATYRTTVGSYSATLGAFSSTGITRGPLQVAVQGGTYSYPDAFPTIQTSTSYLVDVVFNNSQASLTVVSQSPVPGSVGVDRGSTISIRLSTNIANGYAVLVTSPGVTISGTTTLSTDGQTITFTPSAQLPNNAQVTASFSGIATTDGVKLATQTWSFTTLDSSMSTASTLLGTETPAVAASNDASSVELGVSFTPSVAGTVTAIRFYKGTGNTGTHTGHLWSSTGQLLAIVTFANETATGWQAAALSAPVALTAGTKYVVSYLAPSGHYSYTVNYFTSPKTSGPLTAGATTNGLYLYGSSGGFPVNSYSATNYFVDVTFAPTTSTTTTVPTRTSLFPDTSVPVNADWADPGPVQVGVRFTSSVAGSIAAIRFYKGPTNTGTHQVYLWSATGTQLATATATNETASGWQTVVLAQPVPITAGTEYWASYYAPVGQYAVDINGLSTPITSGPLTTVANGGAYTYGTGQPNTVSPNNFWVDVILTQ
jgi:hypothetical protein